MAEPRSAPFSQFAPRVSEPDHLRRAITAAYRLPEAEAITPLIEAARLPQDDREAISEIAKSLVTRLRKKGQQGGVEELVEEYSLSSQEGIALMCLAEALLRIPDPATRNALIRDKISDGDWYSHVGDDRSIFVNAATWGLVVSRRLVAPVPEKSLGASLTGLIRRAGEPVIRSGVNMAMEMMGEQFVTGETIGEALKTARKREAKGFSYSYDMLGEAAMTMDDANRYYDAYEKAIHAIGKGSNGRGVYAGPGISLKLSALHPRYFRSQADRVMNELLPRVKELAVLAKSYDIGFNIDAEESDRLELSLDILETLAMDPELGDWNGLGFVVQAYGKRCPMLLDWIIDLAKRSGHRIMVRLVKGAYWDTEIKRAQVEGLPGFPVFTRKIHTDVCFIASARKLLDAREHVFPQFATHNAQTLATIYHLAGDDFEIGDYEFQCLHGMGEALYEEVVGPKKLNRPCRIYAPVGTHDTLLAYLVRRLLENGANSSFVNRIWDDDISVEELASDPVDEAEAIEPLGSVHELIKLPRNLYPERENSRGLDLTDENLLERLSKTLQESATRDWRAAPTFAEDAGSETEAVVNPADHRDEVGHVTWATEDGARAAAKRAQAAYPDWSIRPVGDRAECLERAADLLDEQMEPLLGLIMREAGKSAANAIAEVREAVDFLRYYAKEARQNMEGAIGVGPMIAISPWNFPLAIFVGEVSAALVAGNTVLAKPAEETPLIAAQAVDILHEAGVPRDVLQLVPGAGPIGAALVGAPENCGVIFTGSTEVAKLIQRQLAQRTQPDGAPIPFIAETGGQNAMVVDSSALPEQVVRDVIASAFDSAGQRCSALRILCLQEEVADEMLEMLRGALAELRVGATDRLSVDVGPVITAEARDNILSHIEAMREKGHRVEQVDLAGETEHGTFVPPTIIEIDDIDQLEREVFGPVLHVMRYERRDLPEVMRQIAATGYGLTFGVHSRIDETVNAVVARAEVGNIYVNRNVIGAIVGVQPFGGSGLSGTGPKAGGPLYLGRLNKGAGYHAPELFQAQELPGPVGERNLYAVHPRGRVLLLPTTSEGLEEQLEAVRATGNTAVAPESARDLAIGLAEEEVEWVDDWLAEMPFDHVLIEDSGTDITPILTAIAERDGPIPIVQLGSPVRPYCTDWMLEEVSTSIDTTAAGGNASLMAVA